MWYVRPGKAQTSLRICSVWSEPLLVAWMFYDSKATDRTSFGVAKLKMRLHIHLSKCHIVGNHMSRLVRFTIPSKYNDWLQQWLKNKLFKIISIKCITKQIWPCYKVGQGQLRITIWSNLVEPTSQMLHAKAQVYWNYCFRIEDFWWVSTKDEQGCHLGHVTN